MSTALVLGNGNLLVNINHSLQVTDFYFPHVGQENHLSLFANKVFFRINGDFFDLIPEDWEIEMRYKEDSLVGESIILNRKYNLEVTFIDFILPNDEVFFREIVLNNKSDKELEVFIYFQNNFSIYENDIGDTALWYTASKSLVHYKKNRYIASGSTHPVYQFTCAARTDNFNRGAYPNEHGELYFNPISTGSVNSCLSQKYNIRSGENITTNNFNVTGFSFKDIEERVIKLHQNYNSSNHESTVKYWQYWVNSKVHNYFGSEETPIFFDDKEFDNTVFDLYKKSLLVIRTQIDNSGAVIAANDARAIKQGGKDTYSYHWTRDSAYIMLGLIDCGFKEISDKYFEHVSNLITPDGYFLHKYYPDGNSENSALGSSWHPWIDNCGNEQLPIQEDETAMVLYAMWKHYEQFADQEFISKYWDKLIFPMANFLGNYRFTVDYDPPDISQSVTGFKCDIKGNDFNKKFAGSKLPRPSYDLWEERRGISAFTCSTVYAGLIAGANLSKAFGREDLHSVFLKYAEDIKNGVIEYMYDGNLGRFISRINCDPNTNNVDLDYSVDASMYGLWHFGMFEVQDKRIEETMKSIEDKLTVETDIGGIARRENDFYHRIDNTLTGNPWFICTLWMAQYYIQKGELEKAKGYMKWVIEHTDFTGLIAEQANPYTGHGESVKPLTWSHGEFVRTVNMLKK